MPIADRRLFARGLLLAADVFLLDQLSKWLALRHLTAPGSSIIAAPFFDLAMVWNKGISFGLLSGAATPYVFIVLSIVIVGILLVWLARNGSALVAASLGAVIGGAMGNVIDRLKFGAVVDFLDFHLGPYHWPAFNIADSAICIGVVLLCASSMLASKKDDPIIR